jgi:hypothetical protein
VGIPTGSAVTTNGSINVSNGYYVNGVLQTGGATIAGSTTAGNLLTATGTSSGIFGNSALTWAPATTTLRVSGTSNTTINGFGIGLGGNSADASYQLYAAGRIRADGAGGSHLLGGGVNLNAGTLSNGAISNPGYNTSSSNFTSVSNTSNYIGGTVLCNGYIGVGTTTFPAFPGVAVTGGLSLTNGYRPVYSNISTANTSGTALTLPATNAYGTHLNITNSGFGFVSITSQSSTDAYAYWVFRNNTGTYLSITISYTTTASGPTTMTIPPYNSVTLLYTGATSSVTTGYVFF